MLRALSLLLSLSTPFWVSSASADEPAVLQQYEERRYQDVELLHQDQREPEPVMTTQITVGIGILGRGTTGIGGPLTEYGYDRSRGPHVDLQIRPLVNLNHIVRLGFSMRALFFSDRGFGASGHAFRLGVGELGISAQSLLPCLSTRDRQLHVGATVAMVGGYANAGLGQGDDMNAYGNLRTEAADGFDHGLVGFAVGMDGTITYGRFLFGFDINLRRLWSIGSTVSHRVTLSSLALRLGVSLGR